MLITINRVIIQNNVTHIIWFLSGSYDGPEGSNSREIFFYFSRNIFISRVIFLLLRKCFYFSENIFFPGRVFISGETFSCFSGNSISFSWCSWFRKAVSGICRLNLHVHLNILRQSLFPTTQQHGKPVEANRARGDKKLYGKETKRIYGEYIYAVLPQTSKTT